MLASHGWQVRLSAFRSAASRWLVLNEETLGLIGTLFFESPGFLHDVLHASGRYPGLRLTRRCVAWGRAAPVQCIPGVSRVIRTADLCDMLEARLRTRFADRAGAAPMEECGIDGPCWHVATQPPRDNDEPSPYGRRRILGGELAWTGADTASWMESAPAGWVFRFPVGPGRVAVQAALCRPASQPAGEALRATLAGLRFSPPGADPDLWEVADVPGAPVLAHTPYGPGRIAIGSAAARFDPVSGDGSGLALRSAILAAAVIEHVESGFEPAAAFEHYATRLKDAFRTHLLACGALYETAGFGSGWNSEVAALLAAGHALPRPAAAHSRFVLRGLRLAERPGKAEAAEEGGAALSRWSHRGAL